MEEPWHEVSAGMEEVRSNRYLFVRRVRIGCISNNIHQHEHQHHSTSDDAHQRYQLMGVHGTCGSERQYHLLLQQLHRKLCALRSESSLAVVTIDCLLYDWLGCGQSSKDNSSDVQQYHDDESRADFVALLQRYINAHDPVILMGHSYAFHMVAPIFDSSYDDMIDQYQWHSMILLSTAIRDDNNVAGHLSSLPDGGPWIITKLPLWILNWIQPMLTRAFIEQGIHPQHKELRHAVQNASNDNRMAIAQAYYSHHHWLTTMDLSSIVSFHHRTNNKNNNNNKINNSNSDTEGNIDTEGNKLSNTPPDSSSASSSASASRSVLATIPILVLHGTDDRIIPATAGQALVRVLQQIRHEHLLQQQQQQQQPSMPSSSRVESSPSSTNRTPETTNIVKYVDIPNTRHLVMLEDPSAVAVAIQEFLFNDMKHVLSA
jgi:pimeloyl-ACP methyl ester carboxylesterase